MDETKMITGSPETEAESAVLGLPVDRERLLEFDRILREYKAGKKRLESRVVAAENWWKLRNEMEARKENGVGWDDSFRAKSAWLHNVIVSKHADVMENYPEPVILPREPDDRQQASILSAVLPVVLEQAKFEKTYSDAMWQKLKTGTAVFKVVWDAEAQNGLGDITIQRVDLLSIFWEPGITDVQNSRYVFHCELYDNEVLESQYPQLKDKLRGNKQTLTRFMFDDTVSTDGKSLVIDVYYKLTVGGKNVLHYCKYVNDQVLASTENEQAQQAQAQAQRDMELEPVAQELAANGIDPGEAVGYGRETPHVGLYDHGLYPFVFDPLWPIEGSPCGYGYVDISMNPQIQIDLLDTAFLKNALNGANPRYFRRAGSSINEKDFLNINKPFVEVSGTLDDTGIRPIDYNALAGNYIGFYENKVAELRETSGNTESSNGVSGSGVTAASAIAALQEASGKTSRDATRASYWAYQDMIEMCIELIRQFYDMPRQFRIVGESGQALFVSMDNAAMRPQAQMIGGEMLGYRLPVYDVKVKVQKRNAYTRMSQNELALQLFNMGFFNPQLAPTALSCLEMMDFEGKDELSQRLAQNGTLFDRLQQMTQIAAAMVQRYEPNNMEQFAAMAQGIAGMPVAGGGGAAPNLNTESQESGITQKARERSNQATEVQK